LMRRGGNIYRGDRRGLGYGRDDLLVLH
jgi:hypothetical protein